MWTGSQGIQQLWLVRVDAERRIGATSRGLVERGPRLSTNKARGVERERRIRQAVARSRPILNLRCPKGLGTDAQASSSLECRMATMVSSA